MPRFPQILQLPLLAIFLAATSFAQQPAAPPSPADQAAQQALDLLNSGKTKEAADAYANIIKSYPTAGIVSEAHFRLGYANFLLGDYDKSADELKKVLAPPAPPEIQESGSILLPQVISAKASKMKTEDPKRKTTFLDAMKQFDAFVQKFPQSEQVEMANYGRALAAFQMEGYDEAAKSLRDNLQKFAASETILDSEYLLALTLATQANAMLREQNASADTKTQANAKFDEAIKFLADIIQRKTDVVLANDAQFQIGEILFNRAAFSEQSQQSALFEKAIAAYRAVLPKDLMIKAQEARIANIGQRARAALAAHDLKGLKHFQLLQEHEQSKLPNVQDTPDKTIAAQIKVGTCFYLQQKFDAARVLLHRYQDIADDPEQKKEILYFLTMSYASEAALGGPNVPKLAPEARAMLVQKAVENYDAFQKSYKGDPIADNLPFALGSLFLTNDPTTNNPEKALQYFKQSIEIYPKGRLVTESLTQQAAAMAQLKRYGEALDSFKKILAGNPKKEIAASAEFGIATINQQTNKMDDAINGYKTVRDKYAGTPEAEQATLLAGQLLLAKGDPKGSIPELQRYIKDFPQGTAVPDAMFFLAYAQAQSGDKTAALQTYKDLETKFPKNPRAEDAYFQRAGLFAEAQKVDDMVAEMRAYIDAYPDSEKIFLAYSTIGQNLVNSQKLIEAIGVYTEMAEKHAQNPQAPAALNQAADLWHRYAESLGRYIALNEQQRTEWNRGISSSMEAAEKLLQQYPDSQQVALGLQTLLSDLRLLAQAKLKTPDDVEKYFQSLAAKFDAKPATKSKILFTLASFIYEKDKAKALAQMQAAYDPKLVYAPADIDLYGTALLDSGKTDESLAVYKKLAADFPNPPGVDPTKAPPQIAEAQAMAIYGIGKALQKQGKIAEAAQQFDQLKKLYPWSPKILEANFGIAQSQVEQGKLDDAMTLLVQIIRAPTATAELRANSMLLGGQIQEKKGNVEAAIDYYIKIAVFYEAVAPAAAEGLWRGGQLLERQAQTLPDTAPDKNKPTPTKPGQLTKATKAYKDISDKYPNSEFASKARERYAALGGK